MKQFRTAIIFISLIFWVHPAAAQPPITLMTEKNPPFNFEQEGAASGISSDFLLLVMEKAGMPVERSAIQFLPWPRAYQAVQEQPGTVLFSMARTDEREKLFKWVGPIQEVSIGLVAAKHRHIAVPAMEDAKKYKIGTIRDGAPEQLVIKAGIDPETLDRIADPLLNIKKLEAGRIDLFAFNVPAVRYMMVQSGLNPDDYEVVYTLKKTALYYAFHKDTDDSLIEKLNAAAKTLKQEDASGESPYARIVKKYMNGRTLE